VCAGISVSEHEKHWERTPQINGSLFTQSSKLWRVVLNFDKCVFPCWFGVQVFGLCGNREGYGILWIFV
jgi:hypothetical protein